MQELTFTAQGSGLVVTLTPNVLAHFEANVQRGERSEAGGQLFGTFPSPNIMKVEKATGPVSAYRRFWNKIILNQRADQREINAEFERGLHYLGDWHTHPVTIPTPSPMDYQTFQSRFRKSTHELHAMLMVIVGTNPFPGGLWVGLQNNNMSTTLVEKSFQGEDAR